ncbi:MAG: GAF domain-containing protein [Crocinitomicaceae bacterium]|jgi:GAF domain-containing protein|nr:GAF domain-containing protein [Crocinitomicaceae bacterium]
MAEELRITGTSREEIYISLLPQLRELIQDETDLVAILANVSAALKQSFGFFWVGFYIVKNNALKLGPFQGTIACMEITYGKGVCGTAWKEKSTQLVPDVDLFPGHIACSNASKSEIVIPIIKNDQVVAVLDVDSAILDDFSETDTTYLTNLCTWLSIYF